MTNRFRKTLLPLLTALVMMFSAAACGQKAEAPKDGNTADNTANQVQTKEPIVIKYPTFQVGVDTSAPALQQVVKNFNEKYGNEVKVEIEEIPGSDNYVNKIKVLLSANQLPDIVYAGGYNLLDMALASNKVVDLTPYLDADPDWKGLFDPRTFDLNSRNGKIYSIPDEKSLIGYFYNKEMFQKAGISEPAKTWEDFFKDCDKLKAAGITPLSMDTEGGAWVTSLWTGAMVGTSGDVGAKFLDKMMPDNYEFPEFVNAIEKTRNMLQNYTTKDAIGGKYDNAANNFLSGNTAIMANGVWMTGDFSDKTKAPEGFADKVGAAMYPGSGMYNAPMLGYFIAAQEKSHIDAAVKVLKYFTGTESEALALDLVGRVPASSKVEISDGIKTKYPLLAETLILSNDAKYQFNYLQATEYPNVGDTYSKNLPMLSSGKMTSEDFCKALSQAAQKNK